MVKINDILEFKKENFFDGAVQADWFYDDRMRVKSSDSYIFHGPKYYGVNQSDVTKTKHKLIDTASFVKVIYDKLYDNFQSSRFMLTIAGYGAGKSHLSVTLASLLSGDNNELRNSIIEKLYNVDEGIGREIKEKEDKNLIIVLNGMNDFNLNNEILKSAKKSLKMNALDDSIFEDMTIAYQTAANFLNTTFAAFQDSYMNFASKSARFKRLKASELVKLLSAKVFEDAEAYEIINEVYKEKTGSFIKWEEGISASSILTKLHDKYVIKEKKFKGIIILFDEFGRYLEYAAAHPNLASESAIQQIFEAVQNCKPSLLFVGFIQSDLSAYLSRVSNQNIARYVSRYENSDKYYLSSNLETVLANLVKKKSKNAEDIVNNIFNNTLKSFAHRLFENMNRWIPENSAKSVWSSEQLFNQTIVRGCYPIHPATISFLSLLSSWMQQRSTLSFLSEIFDGYKDQVVGENGIPYIYPTAVIKSRIFNEMLNAEEKGRHQGQQCTQFNDLMDKFEEKLSEQEKDILRGILLLNIARYKIYDRADNILALMYNTGFTEEETRTVLNNLENELGIIYFDQALKRYAFTAESNSKVDFNKEFAIKKLKVSRHGLFNALNDEIKREIGLDKLEETPFGRVNGITTGEWNFNKKFIEIDEFDERYAINLISEFKAAVHPDTPKGSIVFLYSNRGRNDLVIDAQKVIEKYNLDALPFIMYLINDDDDTISDALLEIRSLSAFSLEERNKFKKYISIKYDENTKKIIRRFNELARKRQIITSNGIEVTELRLKDMCMKKFEDIYKSAIPFVFDGFEKKVTAGVRKRYNNVATAIINRTICSKSSFESLDIELRNRINSVLSVNSTNSWKVLLDTHILTEPVSPVLKRIYDNILKSIKSADSISVERILNEYMLPPYGVNIYSLVLFFIYVLSYNSKNIEIYSGTSKIKINALQTYFNDEKKEIVQNVLKLKVGFREKVSDNVIKDFIDEVNSNTRIERCEELLQRANKIRQDEDIPENLEGILINIETQLKIGVEASNKIYRDLEEAKKEYEESFEKSFKPFNYVRINSYISNIKEGKIPRTNFYYSAEYIEKIQGIREKSLEKIVSGLENYLDKIKLDVNNIDNIKRATVQLCKLLKGIGSVEFAEKIEHKIISIEVRLKEKAKYETILAQCDEELGRCEEYIVKYNSFDQAERILIYWSDYLNSNKVPDDIRNEYLPKLGKLRAILDKMYEKIVEDTKALISKVETLTDSTQLKKYKEELEKTLKKGVHNDFKEIFTKLIELCEDVINDINSLYNAELTRSELERDASLLKNKYSKEILINIVNNSIAEKYDKENTKEESWRQKYIKNIKELTTMSPSQLLQWKSQTELKPYYLTDETLEECEMILDIVNEKLVQFKIENIIELFKQLDDKQRQLCVEKLKSV
ncbi:hypothetical protein JK636_07315 [Clostridium sp. YIM B02515]|uniref:Uncharacterized protein n=1 Tax=Clostridium rhizosphaerae TaxID=2803861 RepID=A0ABS1T8A9_9CLOT|nr:hypothetical protein [Clostridium rhizosphaerae]MBL4935567.1 hypothetical protein [Clostridium rhizosphaerae]